MFEARMASADIAASVTRGRGAIEPLRLDRYSGHHELQPEEHKDCDHWAHIEHPRLWHQLPDRVDDRLRRPKQHLVERARLIDREPAEKRARDNRPRQDIQEGIRDLGDVRVQGAAPTTKRTAHMIADWRKRPGDSFPRTLLFGGYLHDRDHHVQHDDHNHCRKVDHPRPRHYSADRRQQRLGDGFEQPVELVVAVDREPAEQRPHDDRDDQHVEEPGEDEGYLVVHGFPSSIARRCAARTHSITEARNAPFSSSSSPAAVVPAGEVTIARSSAGLRALSRAYSAEPYSVCTTISSATVRGSPTATAPSMRASIKRKT